MIEIFIGSPQLALQTAAHPMSSPSSTKISPVCRAPRVHVPATTALQQDALVKCVPPVRRPSFPSGPVLRLRENAMGATAPKPKRWRGPLVGSAHGAGQVSIPPTSPPADSAAALATGVQPRHTRRLRTGSSARARGRRCPAGGEDRPFPVVSRPGCSIVWE